MRETFRAFVALPLPDPIRERLSRLVAALKQSGADVGWVGREQFHLTLKFLGDISDAQRLMMASGLDAVAADTPILPLALGQAGAFPSVDSPRILWVGLQSGAEPVARLARRIEEVATAAGVPAERRPFSAHITLGRVRSGKGQDALAEALRRLTVEPGGDHADADGPRWQADHVRLYRSELSSGGPTHTVLNEWEFAHRASSSGS